MRFLGVWLSEPNVEKLRTTGKLAAALRYRKSSVRQQAAKRLGLSQDPKAAPHLVSALGDADVEVRSSAIDALFELGDPRAVEGLDRLIGERPTEHGRAIVRTLARLSSLANESMPTDGGSPAFKTLCNCLTISGVREFAAESLGRLGDQQAITPLRETLQRAPPQEDAGFAVAAAAALSKLGDVAAADVIATHMGAAVGSQRTHLALSLGSLGDRRAVEPLCAALQDWRDFWSKDVAKTLGDLSDVRAVDVLCAALHGTIKDTEKGVDTGLVESAAGALSRLADARVIPALCVALEDAQLCAWPSLVERRVLEALATTGDARAVDVFIGVLVKNLSPPTKVVTFLREVGDQRSLAALEDLQRRKEAAAASEKAARIDYEERQAVLAAKCRDDFDALFAEICRIGARDSRSDRGRAREIRDIFTAGRVDLENILESISQRQNRSDARLVAHFWGMDGDSSSRWR